MNIRPTVYNISPTAMLGFCGLVISRWERLCARLWRTDKCQCEKDISSPTKTNAASTSPTVVT